MKLKTYFLIASLLISPLIMASEVTLLSESDQTIDETHYPTTDYVHGIFERKTAIADSISGTAVVGTYYNLGTLNTVTSVMLPTIENATSISSIVFFATMGVANALTFSAGQNIVYYPDGYSLEANSTYEINCLWNGSAWVIATVKVTTSNS